MNVGEILWRLWAVICQSCYRLYEEAEARIVAFGVSFVSEARLNVIQVIIG